MKAYKKGIRPETCKERQKEGERGERRRRKRRRKEEEEEEEESSDGARQRTCYMYQGYIDHKSENKII